MVLKSESTHHQGPNVVLNPSPASLKTQAESDMANRTAALTRYLAALESPPAANGNPSIPTAPDLSSKILVSSSQDHNEFETSFTSSTISGAYVGHKVVAMPSLGGKSVREVGSSREPPAPTVVRRTSTPGHQRSRSAGRAPQGKSSRDIIQDVYDRMGVSREELTCEQDKFQARYRTAAALTAMPDATSRGRSIESSTDGQRRARSLSRGRSVSGRWPPNREQDEREQRSNRVSTPERTITTNLSDAKSDNAPTIRNQVVQPQVKQSLGATSDDANRPIRSTSISVGLSPTAKKPSVPRKVQEPILSPSDDPVDDTGSGLSNEVSNFSVKDRVTAITGGKSNRNFKKRSLPVQYAKRPPPPKIDIYQEIRKNAEDEGTNPHPAPEPSCVPPSPAAAAAADAAAELVRKNHFLRSQNGARHSHGNGQNKSDTFVTPPANKPPLEISGVDESNGLTDSASVAVSSVSADEYMDRSPVCLPAKKEPVSRRWNGVVNVHRSSIQATPSIKSSNSFASDHIDRMVEDRLQSHVMELEARMESQLARLESHLESRMQARLDQLEIKMDKIGAMLTSILTNNKRTRGVGVGDMTCQHPGNFDRGVDS